MTAIEISDAGGIRSPEERARSQFEIRTLRWIRAAAFTVAFVMGGALLFMVFSQKGGLADLRTTASLAATGAVAVAFFAGRCLVLADRVNSLERRLAVLERRAMS